MPAALAIGTLLLVLIEGCSSSMACQGPADCGGNPCCYETSANFGGSEHVACAASASACVPAQGVDTATTRLCQIDADCTAGGVTTVLVNCCPRNVEGRAEHACAASCH